MKKIVIDTKEIFEYRGNCPECNTEQKSLYENAVDTLCWGCERKRREKELKEKYKFLIGSTITDTDGIYNLTAITIKTMDNETCVINTDYDYGNGRSCIKIEKMNQAYKDIDVNGSQ